MSNVVKLSTIEFYNNHCRHSQNIYMFTNVQRKYVTRIFNS